MSQDFQPGDLLIFQLEAAFGLLRLLGITESPDGRVWHLAGYAEMFPDVESAELAAANPAALTASQPHMALTTRAFESTQVARLSNSPLTDQQLAPLKEWMQSSKQDVSDRSVRLMLGLR